MGNFIPKSSPIETRLLGAMLSGALFAYDNVHLYHNGQESAHIFSSKAKYRFNITAQFKIGAFFADFFVDCSKTGSSDIKSSLVIECDGHEFHEKTKQQVERDKVRERAIVAAGYTLLRFAGSEIHRNSDACAKEIRDFLLNGLK